LNNVNLSPSFNEKAHATEISLTPTPTPTPTTGFVIAAGFQMWLY